MKKMLLFAALLVCISCTHPVLNTNEYVVVDTVHVSRNGFNMILGYQVIIDHDSAYYFGWMNPRGELTQMEPRKFEWKPLK